jgi:hypothetical protein
LAADRFFLWGYRQARFFSRKSMGAAANKRCHFYQQAAISVQKTSLRFQAHRLMSGIMLLICFILVNK